jgi:phosphoglycolate phosphatase
MNRRQNQSENTFSVKVAAVLFDLDGTIFDIVERDAFARFKALNELGYSVSLDEVKRRYRLRAGRLGLVKELGLRFTKKEEDDYVNVSFVYFMTKEASDLTRIHEGAYDALSALSGRFRLVVVTSRDAVSSTEDELERFGIRKFLSLIVTREVAARYFGVKSIPLLPFQEQRTKLYECTIGLTKISPENMLCVGDSVGELEPAKRLGIEAIGVLTGFSSKEDMERASIPTIENLSELVRILE